MGHQQDRYQPNLRGHGRNTARRGTSKPGTEATVTRDDPVTPPDSATIRATPMPTAFTNPVEDTLPTAGSSVAHATGPATGFPAVSVTAAVSCTVSPGWSSAAAGVTVTVMPATVTPASRGRGSSLIESGGLIPRHTLTVAVPRWVSTPSVSKARTVNSRSGPAGMMTVPDAI